MNYELFQQGPDVYIPVIIISFVATLIAYGAFPLLFARIRKKTITKKKYIWLCFGFNLMIMVFFIVVNGESSGSPYILWTGAFSASGVQTLKKRGILYGFKFDNGTDPLNGIMEAQAKETVRVMEKNRTAQPDNESDPEFGLVPEKPIFTLATEIVDGQRAYLTKLRTLNGEKITWKRLGSTSVDTIEGMIDIYETFLPSGVPYKTLYINMYGARTSKSAPVGFYFPEQKKVVASPAPVKNQPKQAQTVPKRRSKTPIIILSIICVLLVAANVAQYFMYREAVADTERQLSVANDTINATTEKISKLADTVTKQTQTINSQKTKISDLEDDSDNYSDIIRYAKNENFGYASSNFRASTGVAVVDKDDDNYKFTLTANWTNGGTVEVDYSSYAAWVEFDKNEWSTSTTMTVIPNYEGVCVVTFSNNVDSETFSVLIIVTD